MSDPKNVADSNKVKFGAVQRWAGAGMTTEMTMTIKFKHYVNKCLVELLEAETMVLLCSSQAFSYPGQSETLQDTGFSNCGQPHLHNRGGP